MKNICIRKADRLGTFIAQLKRALHIALFHGYNIMLPYHEFFNTTYLVINDKVTKDNEIITNIRDEHPSIFEANTDNVLKILKRMFVPRNEPSLGEKDLLIHIRSGDAFDKHPHRDYATPPLSYYTSLIENPEFQTVHLIAQDDKNPCIKALLERFPNIEYRRRTLNEDVKLILGARNIAMSYGSFVPEILTFSEKCKRLYAPSYCSVSNVNPAKVTRIDLDDYKSRMTPWLNSPEQVHTMMTYGSSEHIVGTSTVVDIFICTYHADFMWLEYALKSVRKFAYGFRNVVIVTDNDGNNIPDELLNIVPGTLIYIDVPTEWPQKCKHRPGYFFQQYIKLNWREYTDADAVFVLDSDEMLSIPTKPTDFMEDGKFRWYLRKWENAGPASVWKEPTEFILKRPTKYEAMCIPGFVLERGATSVLCAYLMKEYKQSSLWNAFMKSGVEIFSMYNVFGNFIVLIGHDAYKKIIDADAYASANLTMIKSWSYGGLTEEDKARRDKVLLDV